jgi:hypothetical protein
MICARTAAMMMTMLIIPWGGFKVEFMDLKSRVDKPREIRPDYFIVTDDQIVLLK